MSEITTRQCDECSAQHGAVNNWWCVIGDPEQPMFVTFEAAERADSRALADYGPKHDRLDYCSHNCVVTAFNRWLDTGNVVKQEPLPTTDVDEYAMVKDVGYAAAVS